MGKKDEDLDWESEAEERRQREEDAHARRQARRSRIQERHPDERPSREAPAKNRR